MLVHRAGQTHIHNCPHVPIPDLKSVVTLYEQVTSGVGAFHPAPVVAIALNTGHLSEGDAEGAMREVEAQTGLPCTDVFRHGATKILNAILGARKINLLCRKGLP